MCGICQAGSVSGTGGAANTYRFTREDFTLPLELAPLHYDLTFDVEPKRVRVSAIQTYLVNESTKKLKLNQHGLSIESVELYGKHSLLGVPPVGLDAKLPDFVKHMESLSDPKKVNFEVQEYERYLLIDLPEEVQKGQELVIKTVSVCHPNDKVLEGIYYDYTVDGKPKQLITQCQQYGFQRIVPCIDRMASKTFYTITIIADKRYTNVVSTGDLAPGFYKDENNKQEPRFREIKEVLPRYSLDTDYDGPDRHVIKYHSHKVNMAPYLFFLGCGTYDEYKQQVEYPDGDTFTLELLCLPGVAKREDALKALQCLHDSIMWLYLCCGPESTVRTKEVEKVYQLLKVRDRLKLDKGAAAAELSNVRIQLKQIMQEWKISTGYKYTGSVYREIAMENSNFGGMENVGNTTIVSDRLTPSKWLSDDGYCYMEGVKIHEFYHNINGSQVTGASPFEIWLNEAVTVYIQRKREDVIFGADFMRLQKVIYNFIPALGPLAVDRGINSMAVEPIGFNTTHELISGMTYKKAPEFVRMIELILGQHNFDQGLHEYYTKYAYANATTNQWIQCMQNHNPNNSVDLFDMAKCWLKRTGYPTLHVLSIKYNSSKQGYDVQLKQSGYENHHANEQMPWIIPIDYTIVKDGKNNAPGLFILQKEADNLFIKFPKPAATADDSNDDYIVSLARSFSFFGDVKYYDYNDDMMIRQALHDTDVVNRYLSFRLFMDSVKAKLINTLIQDNSQHQSKKVKLELNSLSPSDRFLDVYGEILFNESICPQTRAYMLNVSESIPTVEELQHRYQAIADAKSIILRSLCDRYYDKVLALYDSNCSEAISDVENDISIPKQIGKRSLKILYLRILSQVYDESKILQVCQRVLKQMNDVDNCMTDRDSALRTLFQMYDKIKQNQDLKENVDLCIENVKNQFIKHPIGVLTYINAVCRTDYNKDVYLQNIAKLISEPFYKMNLSAHARPVALGLSGNRKISVMTDDGLKLMMDMFAKIGSVNQMSAYSILAAFGDIGKFDPNEKERLLGAIKNMRANLDPVSQESLHKQLSKIITVVS